MKVKSGKDSPEDKPIVSRADSHVPLVLLGQETPRARSPSATGHQGAHSGRCDWAHSQGTGPGSES